MIIGYLSFGRVPGCLDLGALFCVGEGGTNGGTNGQSASGSRPCSRPAGRLSVLFFGGVREWWFAGRGCREGIGDRGCFG